ncbi:DELLA protein RGL1 [Linum perenne]
MNNTSLNGWSPLSDLDKFDDQWLHMFSPSCHIGSDEVNQPLSQTLVEVGPEDTSGLDPNNLVEPQTLEQLRPSSFELLQRYGKSSSEEKVRGLTVDQVLRIAGERVLEFSNEKAGAPSMSNVPMDPSLSHLSEEDVKNVELVEFMLAAAERVGDQQFDLAGVLLDLCGSLASKSGNAVQRLGHCFVEALRDRISWETEQEKAVTDSYEKFVTTSEFAIKSMQRGQMPMYQIPHLAAVQSILENVASSNKIHVIDLKIGSGQQWVALMQGLTTRSDRRGPLDLLRITAVGLTAFDRSQVEGTGNRLTSFAKSINVPFRFEVVIVEDEDEASDFRPDRFELEPEEESLVVYSEAVLRTLIGQPRRIERVMRALKHMNPRVMIVVEVEANLNSPSFGNRFVDALFHYGAVFENLDGSLKRDDAFRAEIESGLLGRQVSNILGSEGEERHVRGVRIGVWRKFFARFGMVEIEPSTMSLHQAKWFLNRFAKNQGYTMEMNEKSLILGFKATPMICVSTWKFVRIGRLVRDNEELRVEFY